MRPPTDTLLQLQLWISDMGERALDQAEAEAEAEAGGATNAALVAASPHVSVLPVTPVEANRALASFVEQGDVDDAEETLLLMQQAGIVVQPAAFVQAMTGLCRAGKHAEAERVFDNMVSLGVEPDPLSWTALVHAQASAGHAQRALQTLDRVKPFGLASAPMYASVLKALVRARAHSDAYQLWERMHGEPGLAIPLEAFAAMLKMCSQTREVERAFFYMDELRQRGLQPTAATFTALFRACAGAPHWVNGYQTVVFDAMAVMEGCEVAPTVETYNAIM